MYRVGGHWGDNIIREGSGGPDQNGRREGDQMIAWVPRDKELAERIVRLLNGSNHE